MEGIPEAIKKDLYHDQCDQISYFEEPNQPGTYEAAFFRSDKWQTDVIEELSYYADDVALDTRVYRFIPEDTLMEFLGKWGD